MAPENDPLDPEALLKGAIEAVDRSAAIEEQVAYREKEKRVRALETEREKLLLLLDIAGGLHRVDRVEDLLERVLDTALRILAVSARICCRRTKTARCALPRNAGTSTRSIPKKRFAT